MKTYFLATLFFAQIIIAHNLTRSKIFSKYLSPVILVPGDGGCQIEGKWNKTEIVSWRCVKTESEWSTLWLTLTSLLSLSIQCWVDNIRLTYDHTTRTTKNSPGVETRIPGFGHTNTLEYLDPYSYAHYVTSYFDEVVNKLVEIGYERNVTIKGAQYDFRKAPNELSDYYMKLSNLIERTFTERRQKVTLIVHSMGAPVVHYFLNKKSQSWKDKYIEQIISLAGAWGGSAKPLKVYAVGDNLGHMFIPASAMKIAQQSLSSLAFLMPSLNVWDSKETLVQRPHVNYSLSNIQEYFKALNFEDGYEMYKDTRYLLHNAPPPGVKIHCLHGKNVPTIERLIYEEDSKFPDYPTIVQGKGDGTVNEKSASLCLKFRKHQKQPVYHRTYDNVDHMFILRDLDVMQYIQETLLSTRLRNLSLRRYGNGKESNDLRSILKMDRN